MHFRPKSCCCCRKAYDLATARQHKLFVMKTRQANIDKYGLTDFLIVLGAWIMSLSLVYLVITKATILLHLFYHVH